MGICLQDVTGDGPKVNTPHSIDNGFIWVVVRIEERETPENWPKDCPKVTARWYIEGLAFYEQTAIDMCEDATYFIGPLPVNVALPHEPIEWAGAYFPLRKP